MVALTSVDVASGRSVLSSTVRTTTDVGEVTSDVTINAVVQGNIDLVTVPVRVGTTSVTSLGLNRGLESISFLMADSDWQSQTKMRYKEQIIIYRPR